MFKQKERIVTKNNYIVPPASLYVVPPPPFIEDVLSDGEGDNEQYTEYVLRLESFRKFMIDQGVMFEAYRERMLKLKAEEDGIAK